MSAASRCGTEWADRMAAPPANTEAEQAVIGAVLYDNLAMEKCEAITHEDFFDPVHKLLWFVIQERIGAGQRAEPIAVADRLRDDAAFIEFGGIVTLADMGDAAPAWLHPPRSQRDRLFRPNGFHAQSLLPVDFFKNLSLTIRERIDLPVRPFGHSSALHRQSLRSRTGG